MMLLEVYRNGTFCVALYHRRQGIESDDRYHLGAGAVAIGIVSGIARFLNPEVDHHSRGQIISAHAGRQCAFSWRDALRRVVRCYM